MLQQERLDNILKDLQATLEKGRENIYDIADDCRKNCDALKTQIQEVAIKTALVIEQVDNFEKKEKMARYRLAEVSRNFNFFTEQDIKNAYEDAQKLQNELTILRQEELHLRQKRDDLTRQLKSMEGIAKRAEEFVINSTMALKVLQGNIAKFNEVYANAHKKEQLGIWIVKAMEAERRKIARELHDGPAQSLASILIRLDLIRYICNHDELAVAHKKALDETVNIKSMGQECLDEIRRIMFDLKPSSMQETDLISALSEYFKNYEAKYDFNIDFSHKADDRRRYGLSLEVAIFRMVQEAITNIRKHSGVKKALVTMEVKNSHLILKITDEGRGFDLEKVLQEKNESYGIIGMRERAELLGGKIKINSAPGAGVKIIIEVPIGGGNSNG